MDKIDTPFLAKTAKHHTLWGRTFLSKYKRVPLGVVDVSAPYFPFPVSL